MHPNEVELPPVPWTFDDSRDGAEGVLNVYAADGSVVICLGDMEDSTWQDIKLAHLFAAAPDMLAALEYIVNWTPDPTRWNPIKARDQAMAAIAKAKGQPER